MARGLSIAAKVALGADPLRIVHLLELELDEPTGTIRLTDSPTEIQWEGATYYRGGNLLGFSDIEESAALMVNQLTVSLAGVDQTLIALVLQENYLDRTLRIRRGFLNETTRALETVEPFFEGRVNQPAVAEDPPAGTSTVSLTAADGWIDFERAPGRQTNHEQQQALFPGDRGFECAAQTYQDLPWGTL